MYLVNGFTAAVAELPAVFGDSSAVVEDFAELWGRTYKYNKASTAMIPTAEAIATTTGDAGLRTGSCAAPTFAKGDAVGTVTTGGTATGIGGGGEGGGEGGAAEGVITGSTREGGING